jgi:hypothetical protein
MNSEPREERIVRSKQQVCVCVPLSNMCLRDTYLKEIKL